MKLEADTDTLRARSGAIRLLTDELERNMDEIEYLVYTTSGAWQGDAERAFASRIIYVRKQFGALREFFTECADLMEASAERYDRHDSELASRIDLA